MSNAHEFNDKYLRGLKPRQHAYREFAASEDPDDKGFGVVVTPAGTVSFFLSYTGPSDGKRKECRLGLFPATKLRDARAKARQLRYRIRDGEDPLDLERAAKREEQAAVAEAVRASRAATVKDVADFYVKVLRAEGRRSAAQAERIFAVEVLPLLGGWKAKSVTAKDISDVLAGIAGRGKLILANRTRSWLRAAFQLAIDAPTMPKWQRRCPAFDLTHNPVASTKRAERHERPGDRFLSPDELRRVWHGLSAKYEVKRRGENVGEAAPDQLHVLALKLLLATGQRVEEVLGASWREFDLATGEWTIPGVRRKSRGHVAEPHIVPLCDLHLELLAALKACPDTGVDLLFPDPKGKPRKPGSLGHFVERFCRRIEVAHFAPRDSRRTWKTLAGKAGIDLEIRNRIQGHALTDVGSRHYDRWGYLPEKRAGMQKWCDWLQVELSATGST